MTIKNLYSVKNKGFIFVLYNGAILGLEPKFSDSVVILLFQFRGDCQMVTVFRVELNRQGYEPRVLPLHYTAVYLLIYYYYYAKGKII